MDTDPHPIKNESPQSLKEITFTPVTDYTNNNRYHMRRGLKKKWAILQLINIATFHRCHGPPEERHIFIKLTYHLRF